MLSKERKCVLQSNYFNYFIHSKYFKCRSIIFQIKWQMFHITPISKNLTEIQCIYEPDFGKVLWNWLYLQDLHIKVPLHAILLVELLNKLNANKHVLYGMRASGLIPVNPRIVINKYTQLQCILQEERSTSYILTSIHHSIYTSQVRYTMFCNI